MYVNLKCYMDWVALQYGFTYDSYNTDASCTTALGGGNNDETCRANQDYEVELRDTDGPNLELPCKFPFYLDGRRYDKCVQDEFQGFSWPTFFCPVVDSTWKVEGVNSFTSYDIWDELCDYSNCNVNGGPCTVWGGTVNRDDNS